MANEFEKLQYINSINTQFDIKWLNAKDPMANTPGYFLKLRYNFDRLVQERHNSMANALALHLSCTKLSTSCWK